jgi:hypothetical protein
LERCGSLPIGVDSKSFLFCEGEKMNQIETKFFETFNEVLDRGFVIVQDQELEIKKDGDYYSLTVSSGKMFFQIECQPSAENFNGYIPDFEISLNGLYGGYVIEIDGHQWHEKTKEQVRADKEKDRAYLKNCYIPIRFSGSEVYHNAKRCVDEVFEIMFVTADFFRTDELLEKNCEQFYQIEDLQKELIGKSMGFDTLTGFKIQDNKILLRKNVLEIMGE